MGEKVEISKDIVSKEDLSEALHKENWEELWVILVAHTVNRFVYRYGITSNKKDLIERANQKLSEVLSLILIEGTRKWNRSEYSTLKDFVISVIDSHLNNSFKKSGSKEELKSLIIDNSEDLSHEDTLTFEEQRKEVFQFLEYEDATDEELMIFECMAEGVVKPQAIKDELGISDSDFHNAWRRLKSKLKKLRLKLS
ncbi:MAG: hypothetical protein HC819_18215 [Cyclobacteriaceae bacterium]|nr:hypothetical protein [Cyclobacteriaceae bacterium]